MKATPWRAGAAVLALLPGAPAPGSAQDAPVFRSGVELVQVEVRVTADGQPVIDLRPEDFVLKENGREQEIVAFDFVGPHAPPAPARIPAAPAGGTDHPTPTRPDRAPEEYTWLYVIPEVQGSVELVRVADSLRRFIREELPAGFMVSLGGLPFTDDRELLLASLERMTDRPSDSIDPVLDLEDDLVFEREVAAALQRQNDIRTSFVGMSYDPRSSGGRQDDVASLVSVERIDRQILFYGRLALLRYLDLIEQMATLPGKKMILLYRSGLRVDADHAALMEEIAAAAVRHRVSFYTADSRGLLPSAPVDDRRPRMAWDSPRRRSQPDLIGRQMAEVEPQQGLVSLASTTNGRSVVNSSDMGAILRDVVDASSNYYLLGYHPEDPRETGRFRKVSVSVRREGVHVAAPRGYFERKPFRDQSGSERSLALYRALASGTSGDLELHAGLSFFAAPEGRTATLLSTGVRPDGFERRGREGELEATILVRVRDRIFDKAPVYFEQSLSSRVGDPEGGAASDPAAPLVAFNARVDLPPGRYSLRVLFRDDQSGRTGVLDRDFRVPDLTGDSVPSSLLLTRLASPAPAAGESGDEGAPEDLLSAGELRLAPEPGRVFRRGDVIHWTYHLYRPTPEDRAAAERGLQMGLLRAGEWLPPEAVEAGGQAYPEDGLIRFAAWIDTRTLEPGQYTVLAILPDYRRRAVPELSADFELLPGRPDAAAR